MSQFRIQHTLPIGAETFWNKIFLNDEFNRFLYLERLRFRSYEAKKEAPEPDGSVRMVIVSQPQAHMPMAVQKLVGETLRYVERGRFDAPTQRYTFTIEPPNYGDKIEIAGELSVEPRGENSIERILDMRCKVAIFGVGKVIEGFIEKMTRESHDRAAETIVQYAAQHDL